MLLYGANGYTGRLIVAEAVRRGLAPVLAGRDRAAIETLARHHGLPCRVVALDDAQALAEAVRGSGAVLHAAGPFVRTARPMLEACLAERVHYLDITGEIEVFERVFRLDARARAAGVALLPGAGFDVVPSDGLALKLKERLPAATHLDLAFVSEGGKWSRGTLATMIESIDRGGAERRDGRLVPVPPAADGFFLALPTGRRYVVQIPWGTSPPPGGRPASVTCAPSPACRRAPRAACAAPGRSSRSPAGRRSAACCKRWCARP